MAALMPTSTSNASSSWPSARATADSTRSLDNIVCKGVGGGRGHRRGKRERERKRDTVGRVRGKERGAEEVSNCRFGLNLPGGTSTFISTQSKW